MNLARHPSNPSPPHPVEGHQLALRVLLDEARLIAAQAQLLALNARIESVSASACAAQPASTDAADPDFAGMETVSARVETMLRQIEVASGLTRAPGRTNPA